MQSPLHYSNVMIADPVTGGPVRVTWRYLEDGTKVCVSSVVTQVVLKDMGSAPNVSCSFRI